MKTVLLLLFLFALVRCDCPMNCGAHGRCVNAGTPSSRCSCDSGYTGDDCSIGLKTLVAGVSQNGFVNANKWQFYKLTNGQTGALSVDLAPLPDTPNSDCDLYVKFGSLPSNTLFDYRDVEWGTTAHVGIPQTRIGDYFIGVYGSIFSCSYRITAKIEGACPGGCGHGSCQPSPNGGNGVCVCQAGWGGAQCSEQVGNLAVTLNQQVIGDVDQNKWKHYHLDLATALNEFAVIVNITNPNPAAHDCDVYIRYGQTPDIGHWSQKDSSPNPNFAIPVPHPAAGRWYIGFYGYRQCNFKMIVKNTASGNCLSQCSNHGDCMPPCRCRSGYTGDSCENRTLYLTNGEVESGHVDKNFWNWYMFKSDSTNNIIITVSEIGDGDCDFYARHNEPPSRLTYDYLSIGNEKVSTITVVDALQDTIHIGVFGWKGCTYNINTVQTRACPTTCRGTCNNGRCVCPPGYSGVDCTQTSDALYSGVTMHGQISRANEWRYYHFTANQTSLVIALQEENIQNGQAFLGIYLAENTIPTFREYAYANIDDKSQYKSLTIGKLPPSHPPYSWVIGVYGSPLMDTRVPHPISYKILAWEPKF